MIDSHVLVGSCAQVGEGVHLSAAVQIGGVLEPAGARPVIVEDGAFVGGQAGLAGEDLVETDRGGHLGRRDLPTARGRRQRGGRSARGDVGRRAAAAGAANCCTGAATGALAE